MGIIYKPPAVCSVIGNVPVDAVVCSARYAVCGACASYRIAGMLTLSGGLYRKINTVDDDLTVADITAKIIISQAIKIIK